ncbi:MAG: AAA family ATPase, partial [Gammaproteobacteria bacterium]
DLPRQIDPLTSRVMERADHVLVVTQQSITHVRDAKRMVKLITRELALPADRVQIVVNRYDKKNAVSLEDITASTKPGAVYLIPNDYANVSEAINIGVPLYESARTAAITKSFVEIAKRLAGAEEAPSKGRFQNLFAQILPR